MRYLVAIVSLLAVAVAQVLYGGAMRPIFAMPAFVWVAAAGMLGVVGSLGRGVPAPSTGCLAVVLGFAGWMVWRELGSADAWLAGVYLRLTLACLVMYLVFACVVTNPLHRLAFLAGILVLAFVQVGLGAWQFSQNGAWQPMPWMSEALRAWYGGEMSRARGFYLNANHLAWMLNIVGLFAISLTCWGRWRVWQKVLCLYVGLMCMAGVLLTVSRGGLIALAVGLTVFCILSLVALVYGSRGRRFVVLTIVVSTMLLVAGLMGSVFSNSFAVQARYDILLQDLYRPAVNEVVIRQAQLDPLMGTGAGMFSYLARFYRDGRWPADDLYAHDDWVQLAADYGFPAFALAILVLVLHVASGARGLVGVLRHRMATNHRPNSHAAAIQIGALAALAACVVHSFLDFNMQIPANALLASAVLGMLANPGVSEIVREKRAVSFAKRLAGGVIGGAAAVWLAVAVFQALPGEYYWLKAENAAIRSELVDAVNLAGSGIALAPDHAALHRVRGQGLAALAARDRLARGNIDLRIAAREELERSVALAPMEWLNHLALAEALYQFGLHGAAERAVVESIRLSPTWGRGYEIYGELLAQRGDLDGARDLFARSAALGGFEGRKPFDRISRRIKIRDEIAAEQARQRVD